MVDRTASFPRLGNASTMTVVSGKADVVAMGLHKAGVRPSRQGEFVMTRAQMKQLRMEVREMRVGKEEDRWAPIIPLNHPHMRTNAKKLDMEDL